MEAGALATEYVTMDVRFIIMAVGVRTCVQHSVYRLVPDTDALIMEHVRKAVLQGTQEKDAGNEMTHFPRTTVNLLVQQESWQVRFWWCGPNSCMWGDRTCSVDEEEETYKY
ncbi:uncharacterized protein LOC127848968 [Dreissena polymorpha]|uniref:uncharacterized protein LOC127848968 n=1 Tax=Dreissena polymorpha TaxID=45954 RepID=UPI002265030C|nr:uncharacterized protein LOC127848968 [Dreissena polymorpha]